MPDENSDQQKDTTTKGGSTTTSTTSDTQTKTAPDGKTEEKKTETVTKSN